MGTTELAQAIAAEVKVDIKKREDLVPSLRRRLTTLLPRFEGVHQISGSIRQKSKGGSEYDKRAQVWALKKTREGVLDAKQMASAKAVPEKLPGKSLIELSEIEAGKEPHKKDVQANEEVIGNWLKRMRDVLPKAVDLVNSRKSPQTTIIFLDEFRRVLQDIPYPSVAPWTGEMKQMVSQIIDFTDSLLPTNFFGYEERCFDWTAILARTNDTETRELLKAKILRRIIAVGILKGVKFEYSPYPLLLYQDLNDYATEPMMDLVKTALSDYRWGDDRFKKMHQHIRFGEMSLKNPEGHQKVVDYLYEQMKANEGARNLVGFEKAKMLWERASRGL